jgi:3-hydroxybutyryl-CoA dehydrogenase
MRFTVICDELSKEELLVHGTHEGTHITWVSQPLMIDQTDCYIDLLFQSNEQHITALELLKAAIIIVNDVSGKKTLPENFIRINGWPGFLKRTIIEASNKNNIMKAETEKIFSCFNRNVSWTPDQPGFITARVIAMIINEAFFALGENVSTRTDIDTAMKTGTNYPYGPFEWCELIGPRKVFDLLETMKASNIRYEPAPLLRKEVKLG